MPAFGDPSNDPNYQPMPGDHARDSTRGGKIKDYASRTQKASTRTEGSRASQTMIVNDEPRLSSTARIGRSNRPKPRVSVADVLVWVAVLTVITIALRGIR